ncbi:MAG: DUF1659 domain-containing protein [Tuberibacillus sp.]
MATANLVDSSMVLAFNAGMDGNGKTVVKRKSFNNLKAQVTNDQLFAIAQALIPLQQYSLIAIQRNDTTELYA